MTHGLESNGVAKIMKDEFDVGITSGQLDDFVNKICSDEEKSGKAPLKDSANKWKGPVDAYLCSQDPKGPEAVKKLVDNIVHKHSKVVSLI